MTDKNNMRYYDEDQYYEADENTAIDKIKAYVTNGVEHTYGILSISHKKHRKNPVSIQVSDELCDTNSVVYSITKIDGIIVENFVEKDS